MSSVFITFIITAALASGSHGWSYKEQDQWPAKYCQNAIAQSPIDLVSGKMIQILAKPLSFKSWDKKYNCTITNNGHTIIVEVPNGNTLSVSGGALPGTYNLVQFHFHWGSEHVIDGERKALEAHFVTYNNKFDSLSDAVEYNNGIAVITVMYDLSDKDNTRLVPIIQELHKLKNAKQSTQITINPERLLPDNKSKFYRYFGSLTTPDCNDVVVWTIFADLCIISSSQVDQFASIKDTHGHTLSSNYRQLQSLNDRSVYDICTESSCC